MKKLVFAVLLLTVFLSSFAYADLKFKKVERRQSPNFVGYVDNEIVVKFDQTAVRSFDKSALPAGKFGVFALDQIASRYRANRIRQQFPGARPATYRGKMINLAGWFKVRFAAKVDVDAAVQDFLNAAGVQTAQKISIHSVDAMPNDPNFSDQWHLNQSNDHDEDAPEAWDIQTGDESVIVAILDTGVRYFHKDLGGANASYDTPTDVDGNMWINWAEKNGTAGVDDDGNGYIDDWVGWDFVDGVTGEWPGEDANTPDNDPRDFNGHGTHCAGNVGAINNNGYATAAVSGGWGNGSLTTDGNGVKVMALRIGWSAQLFRFFEVGYVRMDFAAEAFYYAADNGAKIASCSWGSSNDSGLGDAVDYFLANGGLIFKAAGNDNNEDTDYMTARDDIISVAATDENDVKADFSSYGTWVDISAPGNNIYSLYHDHNDPENDYVASMSGTSMATPIAASVAALIWSQNTGWSASQVEQQLYDSADDIYGISGNSSYSGKLGAGRVNAFNAVNTGGGTPPPTAEFSGSPTSGCAPLTVNFTDESTGEITSWSWDFGDGGSSTQQNPSHQYTSAGNFTVALTVTGPGGSDTNTKSNYISVSDVPAAEFSGSPTSGTAPLTVDFTDQSTGNPTSWSWDFGDGGTSTQQNPSHTYNDVGTYTVTLTATNSCGSDVNTKVDYITVSTCNPPVADFVGSPTSGDAPLTVNFTDQSTNNPTSWSWDFGDGGSSTVQNPSHEYANAGTYTVALTATNSCGSDTQTKTDYITVSQPPQQLMHVNAVDVTKEGFFIVTHGKADVQVVDAGGSPVADATVTGVWSGGATDTDEFTTGSDGWGSAVSDWHFGDATFTFCVTNVSKSGWTYDEAANVATCGSSDGTTTALPSVSPADMQAIEAVIGNQFVYNTPNPFNPTTTIKYFLPKASHVKIDIYNILGKRIATLFDARASVGVNSVTWNARDESGQQVGSGNYFYVITIDKKNTIVKKMLFLK